MRVVLIAPAATSYIWRKRRAAFTMPPMALPVLAACTPPGVEIKLIDEAVEDVNLNLEADMVGLSAMTPTAPRAYALADHFRSRGIPVVMGGVHPSVLPDEALRHCDSVVIGEAENLWASVLQEAGQGRLKRTYQDSAFISLDNLPPPRWNLLLGKRYFIPQTIQVSRGCPIGCSFCSVSSYFGRSFRFRPIPQVIEEVKSLPRKLFIFVDDNIAGEPDQAKELFAAMIPLKKKWVGQCSLSIAEDPELLDLAARSGCIGLLIGFESISPAVLRSIGKQVNLRRKYEEAIGQIHGRSIHIQGSFIFGFDGDTLEAIRSTAQFVKKNRLTGVNYCHLTPFPGTKLFADLEKEGRILHRDWSKYDRQNIVFLPRNFTPEELQDHIFWAYRQTYNWRSFWQRRPSSFHHFSLYLALNFGYMKGVRKMERNAQRSRKGLCSTSEVVRPPGQGT
ncbi:MAG: B12-binding domain-containing radical SAM protein [Deltaproteobacteria bacterium]|nr:B12-binding domain-containing radical SAM protein [Deltaproteobacteria bacterium]